MWGNKKGEELDVLLLHWFWICACYAPTLSCPHSHGMDVSATIALLLVATITPSTPTQPQPLTSLPSPPSPPSHRTPSPIPLVPHAVCPPIPPSQLPSPPPPPKFAPAHVPTPPLASRTDPLTPRTEELLRLPLPELDSRFDMGWSRYVFALRRQGQVQMWQRGQRLSRSHFLNPLLERARLMARATQSPKAPDVFAACAACHMPPCTSPWSANVAGYGSAPTGLPASYAAYDSPPSPSPSTPTPHSTCRVLPSARVKGASPSRRCRGGSCAHPRPQPRSPLPDFSNRRRPYPRRGSPPPPRQPRSKETAEQCNARTSGARRFVVCSCTMSDAGPDGSASNKSQTFRFEYMGPGPCEPGEYQSPCGPQANGPSHSRTKRPRPLTRVVLAPAAAPSS